MPYARIDFSPRMSFEWRERRLDLGAVEPRRAVDAAVADEDDVAVVRRSGSPSANCMFVTPGPPSRRKIGSPGCAERARMRVTGSAISRDCGSARFSGTTSVPQSAAVAAVLGRRSCSRAASSAPAFAPAGTETGSEPDAKRRYTSPAIARAMSAIATTRAGVKTRVLRGFHDLSFRCGVHASDARAAATPRRRREAGFGLVPRDDLASFLRRSGHENPRPERSGAGGRSAVRATRRSRPASPPARPRTRGRSCPGATRSQRGRYQFHSPSSFIVAGRSTARTIVASIRIAVASPTPNCLNISIESVAKIENTATITTAALVTTPAVRPDALRDRLVHRRAPVEQLADPPEHEDVVVHRQAEQDHEEQQRHDRVDPGGGAEAEQPLRRRRAGTRSRARRRPRRPTAG